MAPKLKYLALFDNGRLEFRLESAPHPLWRWRCALLHDMGVFRSWECWKETSLESGQRSAKSMAKKLTESFPVELAWRNLSDMDDEIWDRSMHDKQFPGWPDDDPDL